MHRFISLIDTHTCLTGEVNSIYWDFATHLRLTFQFHRLHLTVHLCNLNNFSVTLLGLSKLNKQKGMAMHSTGHRLVLLNSRSQRVCEDREAIRFSERCKASEHKVDAPLGKGTDGCSVW